MVLLDCLALLVSNLLLANEANPEPPIIAGAGGRMGATDRIAHGALDHDELAALWPAARTRPRARSMEEDQVPAAGRRRQLLAQPGGLGRVLVDAVRLPWHIDTLQIPWHEVHREATLLEPSLSPALESRLVALVGDARTCPHGNPIPGQGHVPAEDRPLTAAPSGIWFMITSRRRAAVLRISMMRFGIEHEVAFLRPDGQFADFANTSFAELDQLIDQLPLHPEDYPGLYVGDAGIRKKRWYIEGVERFDESGALSGFDAKGVEIRTTVHPSIQGALDELTASYGQLAEVAQSAGLTPIALAHHPYHTGYRYNPPLNAYERQLHQDEPEYQTEHLPMVTFGPDFNLSWSDLGPAAVIDLGRKLTFYSPAIVPFSFNAPFYAGQLWEGLSVRTAFRTGARPAVRVYLADAADLIVSTPILTKLARHPQEVGRVEFKACDSCGDFTLYAGLLALLKGLAMDQTLPGRATTPDTAQHQRAARGGLADPLVAAQAAAVLGAASAALIGDPDAALLEPLALALVQASCPAQALRDAALTAGSVDAVLGAWRRGP